MEKIDLMGSEIDWQSLKKLVLENRKHLKDLALPNGCSDEQMETLLGHLQSLKKLTVPNPQGTGQWLQYLPQTMEILDINWPDGSEMEWSDLEGESPTVTIRHATDSTLAFLTGLADRLNDLTITESPLVTASGLLHVGSLTKLEELTLHGVPASSITDAVLEGLNSCSELWRLQLGDKDQPQETAITAAAVSRLAVDCRELLVLRLHTTADSSQAVLNDLHRTDLGSNSRGWPRHIELYVPEPVYSQLSEPPSDSQIRVRWWWRGGTGETVSSGCEQD